MHYFLHGLSDSNVCFPRFYNRRDEVLDEDYLRSVVVVYGTVIPKPLNITHTTYTISGVFSNFFSRTFQESSVFTCTGHTVNKCLPFLFFPPCVTDDSLETAYALLSKEPPYLFKYIHLNVYPPLLPNTFFTNYY